MALEKLDIASFYDKAIKTEFSRDILFRVTNITPPFDIDGSKTTEFLTPDDLVYAKSAKVPARTITNVEAKYVGLTFNLPGVVEYPDSSNYELEFYCDVKSSLRTKFEQWSRATFNDSNSTGNYANANGSIDLVQLDSGKNIVQKYQLVGVSIRNVGDISYDIAEGTGAIQSFKVSFGYHYYILKAESGQGTDLPKAAAPADQAVGTGPTIPV